MPRITISEPGKTPQPYRLKTDRKITKIGRASDNDVILTARSASTYHCEMKRVEGGFILVDNNSTNGIKLEDTRYSTIDLEDGIEVKIGDDIDLSFELTDSELELLDDEEFESHQKAMFPKAKKKKKAPEPIELDEDEDEEEEKVAKPKPKKKKKAVDLSLDDDDDFVDDDEDEDEDETPKSKLKTSNSGSSRSISSNSRHAVAAPKANSLNSTILFILLAILFLLAGMAIRHWQDYQTFIFS